MATFFSKRVIFWSISCGTITNVDLRINALHVLYQNNLAFNSRYFKNELKKRANDFRKESINRNSQFKQDELKYMKDDFENATNESLQILSNFIIVAAYSFYEMGLKRIMCHSKFFTKPEIKSCFKNENILELFKNKGIINNMKDIDNYKKINELRCLNNAIKHNGIVDKWLNEANNRWIEGTEIENTHNDFLRLKNGISEFLIEIMTKIENKIEN